MLTTLHTNDAASTPLRLVEMGVEPFLVTSALDCVLAQRLARRLCDQCAEQYQPSEAELVEAGWPMEQSTHRTGRRCTGRSAARSAARTGYRGRFALHEVLLVTEEIEKLIIERRSTEDVKKMAVMQGMVPLRGDGFRKVGRRDDEPGRGLPGGGVEPEGATKRWASRICCDGRSRWGRPTST